MKTYRYFIWALIITSSFFVAVTPAQAAVASLKLPYVKGESFVVTQGYDSPPTHIKKDAYALDLTQDGCDAYGKAVVATAPGKAMFVSEEGYNGGYGTELIIDHGNALVSRYAHMIPDSIKVAQGEAIKQGAIVGYVGDTGLVAGAACADHPGAHLHFVIDTVNADGTFSAYNPEPISGYTNMTEGKWYISDNGPSDDIPDNTSVVAPSTTDTPDGGGEVLGAYDVVMNGASDTVVANATSAVVVTAPTPVAPPPVENVSNVGVSFTPANSAVSYSPPAPSQPSTEPLVSVVETVPGTTEDDSSSTIQDPAPSSTTVVATSSVSTATSSKPVVVAPAATSSILFAQTDDEAQSHPSFYDDNWFDLGDGFSGTLNALTLEGEVSDPHYLASHVYLQEFKDQNYTAMIQQFVISDNAPFTDVMATTTFSGLSISLKPYFYYRIATIQDWQNRSVILAGTPSTTVGVVMWDNFVYGVGGVQSTSTFFPYMIMEGPAATLTITPPPLPPPSDLIIDFDEMQMQVTPSFSISTDPDWPANPLHFEMNYSTSTSLADDGWTELAPIPLVFGNSYLFGVRAEDNFGDISVPATTSWNFPPGFEPYTLSPELGYASQYFTVPTTSTLESIQLFTTNLQTNVRNPENISCTLSLLDSDAQPSPITTPSDNGVGGYGCASDPFFSFASSSLLLSPSHRYQWIFQTQTGNPSTGAGVQFYGNLIDNAGGLFSDPSLVNARFVVNGDSGVIFAN